jgi:hypothetical protein
VFGSGEKASRVRAVMLVDEARKRSQRIFMALFGWLVSVGAGAVGVEGYSRIANIEVMALGEHTERNCFYGIFGVLGYSTDLLARLFFYLGKAKDIFESVGDAANGEEGEDS